MNNNIDDIYDDEELLNPNGEQYFFFLCGSDRYALKALSVSEILENQQITKVPKCEKYIKGVVNIRGNLIGVIDLLDRFEVGEIKEDNRTSIVVVTTKQDDKEYNIGMMIDEIFEVDGLDTDSIITTPSFGTKIQSRFIKYMARYNKNEISVLDEDEVLKIADLSVMKG
ncbi:MAG: purine-binding chemotaxis protein CheW [Arcobacteraceae bacterium]|nr:purine-binding chemotaxis protein CheW [Arcobacteraceae bacterium]